MKTIFTITAIVAALFAGSAMAGGYNQPSFSASQFTLKGGIAGAVTTGGTEVSTMGGTHTSGNGAAYTESGAAATQGGIAGAGAGHVTAISSQGSQAGVVGSSFTTTAVGSAPSGGDDKKDKKPSQSGPSGQASGGSGYSASAGNMQGSGALNVNGTLKTFTLSTEHSSRR